MDMMAPQGPYAWPRPARSLRRRLSDLRWRLIRWNRKQNCIAHHRHAPEDQGVRGVGGARLWWCRACSSIEWID